MAAKRRERQVLSKTSMDRLRSFPDMLSGVFVACRKVFQQDRIFPVRGDTARVKLEKLLGRFRFMRVPYGMERRQHRVLDDRIQLFHLLVAEVLAMEVFHGITNDDRKIARHVLVGLRDAMTFYRHQ